MKGDIIVVEDYHREAARIIIDYILNEIKNTAGRYTMTVSGESGSGKSETGQALADELAKRGIRTLVLGQDDYFALPPKSNDAKRREDPEWLGPHVEVKLALLNQNLKDAMLGKSEIVKPLIDYDNNSVDEETVDLTDVQVVIAEGTYTALLKDVRTRVFIERSRTDTLAHRQKRNRGNEANDPFVERILMMEHKIIAGHKFLANYLITKEFDVIAVEGGAYNGD